MPFDQVFVRVRGAVNRPGIYPYIPERIYEYYRDLAGGINPEQRIGQTPRVYDKDGNRKDADEPIEPEDVIEFRPNNPLATIAPWVGFASSVASPAVIAASSTSIPAHPVVYGVLAILTIRTFRSPRKNIDLYLLSFLIATAVGAADELHQSVIPERSGQPPELSTHPVYCP